MSYSWYTTLLLLVFFIQCNTINNQPVTDEARGQDCETVGNVEDFTGLDGCGLMLVTTTGLKLIPAKIAAPGFDLQKGQTVRFSYQQLEDQMSICMAEDAIVEVTCIQLVQGTTPLPRSCDQIDSPDQSNWLSTVVENESVSRIIRFPYRTDGWAYLLTTSRGTLLYDCQGTRVCESDTEATCMDKIDQREAGVVIYAAGR